MSDKRSRRPTAFKLDDVVFEEGESRPRGAYVETEPDIFAEPAEGALVPAVPRRRPRRIRRFFWIGLAGLITLALGLAIDNLVRSLFERTDWLGWVGVAFVALAVIALIGFAIRELVGISRIRQITAVQALAADAIERDDRQTAREAGDALLSLYGGRPEMARGRNAFGGHLREIIDGRDLIRLAETELMTPLDREAKRLVMNSAKRVSLVTAISPRALIDVLFVLVENLRLIRRLATVYGGRPGTFGFLRLARRAISHLAVTGGMAAGESLFQQVLGHGVAARLSTRLGEGVINGILTARIGIAAIDVCRPLPFVEARPPRLADIVGELTRRQEKPAPEDEGPANPG